MSGVADVPILHSEGLGSYVKFVQYRCHKLHGGSLVEGQWV